MNRFSLATFFSTLLSGHFMALEVLIFWAVLRWCDKILQWKFGCSVVVILGLVTNYFTDYIEAPCSRIFFQRYKGREREFKMKILDSAFLKIVKHKKLHLKCLIGFWIRLWNWTTPNPLLFYWRSCRLQWAFH